jgi:hypothetical protein
MKFLSQMSVALRSFVAQADLRISGCLSVSFITALESSTEHCGTNQRRAKELFMPYTLNYVKDFLRIFFNRFGVSYQHPYLRPSE